MKFIKTTEQGRVDVDHLRKLMDEDVIFVTVMAVNNIVGAVQPIQEIAEILKGFPKAHFHVDATQAVGKVEINYENVDTLSISGHKFHGVKGSGALITRELKTMPPIFFGGGHEYNLRSGTVNLPAVAAMAKALRLSYENTANISGKIEEYNQSIRNALAEHRSIVIQPGDVPHILNLSYVGAKGEVAVNALSEKGIMVSTTSACASKLATLNETLTAMGQSVDVINGSIRISMSKDTEEKDVDMLIKGLKEVYEEIGDVLI